MAAKGEASIKRTIRRQQLREMVPLADSTIYEMEQRGEFTRRFALSLRCVVWDLSEVEAWLASRRSAPIARAAHGPRAVRHGAAVSHFSPNSPKLLASRRRRFSRCFSIAGDRPSAIARLASMQSSRARASDSPAGPYLPNVTVSRRPFMR